MSEQKSQILNNQDGFAAIVIALVIIMVLSLMTIGFAQLMRSNQQAALSKQLSSQAYYAAESGVNDAYQAYENGFNVPKTNCTTVPSTLTPTQTAAAKYLQYTDVNSTTSTAVTCLLMNPDPPSVKLGNIGDTTPQVVEMQGCSTNGTPASPCSSGVPSNVGTINIQWNDSDNRNGLPASCSTLTPSSGWKTNQNILRIELIPLSGDSSVPLNRNSLINNTYTAYLCPDNAGSGNYTLYNSSTNGIGLSYSTNNTGSGDMLDGSCTGSAAPCNVTLNVANLRDSANNPYSTYFLVVRSMYPDNITATITMKDTANPANYLDIADSQLLVDSTGKSQDTVKRLEVRIPENSLYDLPSGVEQGEVCKELYIMPPVDGSTDNTPSGSLCQDYRQ